MQNYRSLLDGAIPGELSLSKETKQLIADVKNKNFSLLDRVESYEDIMNLEVGDTSFTRARNIERDAGMRQIYLKFEGGNPTGTQKDRIAFAQCHDAIRREFDTITLASCGNYGASVALAANLAGLKCIIYIPESFHTLRVKEMEDYGAIVKGYDGTYEDSVSFSSQIAAEKTWYDANPGGANTPLQIKAYAEIAYEIYDQLRDAPRIVSVPVSNGTLLAGIYRGFVSLYKKGKTSNIPKLIAASSSHKNPIIYSFRNNLEKCIDLIPEKIKGTKVNEPLINWHSFDGDEALYALKQTKGEAFNVSDEKMLQQTKKLKEKEGLQVLPASTASLVALLEYNAKHELEPDRYVAILTGRKQ